MNYPIYWQIIDKSSLELGAAKWYCNGMRGIGVNWIWIVLYRLYRPLSWKNMLLYPPFQRKRCSFFFVKNAPSERSPVTPCASYMISQSVKKSFLLISVEEREFSADSEYQIRFFIAFTVLELLDDLWTSFWPFWPKMTTLWMNNSRTEQNLDMRFSWAVW